MYKSIDRRTALAGLSASTVLGSTAHAQDEEFDLVNDAPRGQMGNYDVTFYGPPATRAPVRNFRFPAGAEDSDTAYGIDISHHVAEVPWASLRAAKVNYVYMKASQSVRGRDRKFQEYWEASMAAGLPCGAYHFLTAGAPGADQAAHFLRRLALVGGLRGGRVHLQPVVDLEWDFLGPQFTPTPVTGADGVTKNKDYWSDLSSDEIVQTMRDFIDHLKAETQPLAIKPLIYTNRSWWEERLHPSVRFDDCTLWPSDYRRASYRDGSPRSVAGHTYHVWQFTDSGRIDVADGRSFGPFDCNKIVVGSLDDLLIA